MQNDIDTLKSKINNCLLKDQFRFQRKLSQNLSEAERQKLQAQIRSSLNVVQTRLNSIPAIVFPRLPISHQLDNIRKTLDEQQVIIIVGETGSGKSTQLAKICLQAGFGGRGWIGHTQPRRIAARSIATRVAEELGDVEEKWVGYQVRFDKTVHERCYIKLMTDGILLQEIKTDPYLSKYEVIIVDEAHERSINIDLVLGHLKRILHKRKDLKLIVTSATIDYETLSNFFLGAPVIHVSGKIYPIELNYAPIGNSEYALEESIVDHLRNILQSPKGDVLVFLPTEFHISRAYRHIKKQIKGIEVLPLYSRLRKQEQDKIFNPSAGKFRAILATNIAETSLTVPNIHYVIDTGLVRINRYHNKHKVTALPIEWISQSSANQRKGRCGRLAPGRCIRLYSEDQFCSMKAYTDPEIIRCNLANVILQLAANRLGDIKTFPFILPPKKNLIDDGIKLLKGLNALDEQEKITAMGRKMAQYPLEPRFSRMIIEATHRGCLKEVMIIVSCLSNRIPELSKVISAKRKKYESEFLRILQLWELMREKQRKVTRKELQVFYQSHGLSYNTVSEWMEIYSTLVKLTQIQGEIINRRSAAEEQILKSLLSGLITNIGIKQEKFRYLGARNMEFYLHPATTIGNPPWVVAMELVKTSKLYARVISQIKPRWIAELAPHLLKKHYAELYWDEVRQQVVANESATVFGLPIYKNKRVNYGKINSQSARQIFIQQALFACRLSSHEKHYQENCRIIRRDRERQNRLRHHGDLREGEIVSFYDELLPQNVCDKKTYESWAAEKELPILLLAGDDDGDIFSDYPEKIRIAESESVLRYVYEPGKESDGITLTLKPLQLLQTSEITILRSIPGLLAEKIKYCLQSLPKRLRKQFIPVAETARQLASEIAESDSELWNFLADYIARKTGEDVLQQIVQIDFPEYLNVRYQLVDEDKEIIKQSRSFQHLQATAKQRAVEIVEKIDWGVVNQEYQAWNFGDIPVKVEKVYRGKSLIAYPAITPSKNGVRIQIYLNAKDAKSNGLAGQMCLIRRATRDYEKQMKRDLVFGHQCLLSLRNYYSGDDLQKDIVENVYATIFDLDHLIYCKQDFEELLRSRRNKLLPLFQERYTDFKAWCDSYTKIYAELNRHDKSSEPVKDILNQIDRLIFPGFIRNMDSDRLKDYVRYFHGIELRMQRWNTGMHKDIKKMRDLIPIWRKFWQAPVAGRQNQNLWWEVRWDLEELRMNIFAPELGAKYPCSEQKIRGKLSRL